MSATLAHLMRPGTLQLATLPPLALYVHLPWCIRKCPYCDFNSHEMVAPTHPSVAGPRGGSGSGPAGPGLQSERAGAPAVRADAGRLGAATVAPRLALGHAAHSLDAPVERQYLDALRADLEAALPLIWGRPVVSVFVGGGTPSLFSPDGIARLLSDVRALLPLAPGAEVTLEANPGTFERERFAGFRAAGVTRLSVGVQSFDDVALHAVGRVHDAAQAHAAVAAAGTLFDTWNLDLMYALPGQTVAALQADLDAALAHAPPHLSVYHLTLEPNTAFALRPPPALPDDDSAAAMLDAIVARTAAAGLQRYEVSAFAKPRHRCAHNVNYWEFGDYLGIGAGAHGKLSFPHRVLRQVRWREPAAYVRQALAGDAVSNEHEVARADLPFEFMLGALRLREGFDAALFGARTGLPPSTVEPRIEQACARGLLERDGQTLRPTARGFDFLSDLQALFLPDGRPPR